MKGDGKGYFVWRGIRCIVWNGWIRRADCVVCGKRLEYSKEWSNEYCKCHQGTGSHSCGGSTDWGTIMENNEKGFLNENNIFTKGFLDQRI